MTFGLTPPPAELVLSHLDLADRVAYRISRAYPHLREDLIGEAHLWLVEHYYGGGVIAEENSNVCDVERWIAEAVRRHLCKYIRKCDIVHIPQRTMDRRAMDYTTILSLDDTDNGLTNTLAVSGHVDDDYDDLFIYWDLSTRERECCLLGTAGYNWKEVASLLQISKNVVKHHIRRIKDKILGKGFKVRNKIKQSQEVKSGREGGEPDAEKGVPTISTAEER